MGIGLRRFNKKLGVCFHAWSTAFFCCTVLRDYCSPGDVFNLVNINCCCRNEAKCLKGKRQLSTKGNVLLFTSVNYFKFQTKDFQINDQYFLSVLCFRYKLWGHILAVSVLKEENSYS